jgi:hypothetical protein
MDSVESELQQPLTARIWTYRKKQLAHALETRMARMYMMRPGEVEALPLETRGFTDRLSLRVRTNLYVVIELMKC